MQEQVAEKLIKKELEVKSGVLDLGNLSLSELPILLKECTHLKKLVIGNYSNVERVDKGWRAILLNDGEHPNTFSNCAIISSLVELKELHMKSIRIQDVSFIGALSNLEKLDIHNIYIQKVAPLLNNQRIESLSITADHIVDLEEVYKLYALKELNIWYSPPTFNRMSSLDLKGIENLKDLKTLAIITENGANIENGLKLNKLNKLEELRLLWFPYLDISELSRGVKKLFLGYITIRNFDAFYKLTALEELMLYSPFLDEKYNLSYFKTLKNLTKLRLGENDEIENLGALSDLINLTDLSISFSSVKQIKGLSNLTKLERLNIDCPQVADLSAVDKMLNLKELSIAKTQVLSLEPLASLEKLEVLNITKTNVTELPKAFINFKRLKKIYFEDTDLRGISINSLNSQNIKDVIKDLRRYYDENALYITESISNISYSISKMNQGEFMNFVKMPSFTLEEKANFIIQRELIHQSGFLDLSDLGLKKLPEAIANCSWLRYLAIGEMHKKEEINWSHKLNFGANDIQDLSLISNLKNLEVLLLGGLNNLSDISCLREMSGLKKLDIKCTKVDRLDVLKNLTLLEDLNITMTNVADLQPIANLKQLKRLDARYYLFNDLSALGRLANIVFLDLGNFFTSKAEQKWYTSNLQKRTMLVDRMQVVDISALSSLRKLDTLYLYGSQIMDLNPIMSLDSLIVIHLANVNGAKPILKSKLKSLRRLTIINCAIDNLDFISTANKLEQLSIKDSPVTNFSWTKGMNNLVSLSLSKLKIKTLKGIEDLKGLQLLFITDLPLESFQAIKSLDRLEQLQLSNLPVNQLRDLSPSKQLTFLIVNNTPLVEVDFLYSFEQLTYLGLNRTELTDIKPLSVLLNLTTLNLENSPIKSVEPLENCRSIKRLKIEMLAIEKLPRFFMQFAELESIDLKIKDTKGDMHSFSRKGSNAAINIALKEYFSENSNNEVNHLNIKVPKSIRVAVKQYFQYFEEYLIEVKNVTGIFVNVISNEEGVEVKFGLSESKLNDDIVLEHFEEYKKLAVIPIQKIKDKLKFENSKSEDEKELIRIEMKSQIQHLQLQLELKNVKIKHLEKNLNRIEISYKRLHETTNILASKSNSPINVSVNQDTKLENNIAIENNMNVVINNFIRKVLPEINDTRSDRFLSEDQKIKEIEDIIDDNIIVEKEKKYKKRVSNWLPNFEQLDSISQTYLISAEFLLDILQKAEANDYSPYVIQSCRVIENELKKQLFTSYHEEFKMLNESERENILDWDMEGGGNRNKELAKLLKQPSLLKLMVGSMVKQLMKVSNEENWMFGGKTEQYVWDDDSKLKEEFVAFIRTKLDLSIILKRKFIEDLEMIRTNYRNQAAHPDEVNLKFNSESIVIVKDSIREWLSEWGTSFM